MLFQNRMMLWVRILFRPFLYCYFSYICLYWLLMFSNFLIFSCYFLLIFIGFFMETGISMRIYEIENRIAIFEAYSREKRDEEDRLGEEFLPFIPFFPCVRISLYSIVNYFTLSCVIVWLSVGCLYFFDTMTKIKT